MDVYIVRHGQTDSNLAKVFNTYIEDINENAFKSSPYKRYY